MKTKKFVKHLVLMISLVVFFTACKKDKDPEVNNSIVGKWQTEKLEIKEVEFSNPSLGVIIRPILDQMFSSEQMKKEIAGELVEFTADGKAISNNKNGNEEATYTLNGQELTITDKDGEVIKIQCSIAGNTMNWDIDLFNTEFGDELGEMSEMGVTKLIIRAILNRP